MENSPLHRVRILKLVDECHRKTFPDEGGKFLAVADECLVETGQQIVVGVKVQLIAAAAQLPRQLAGKTPMQRERRVLKVFLRFLHKREQLFTAFAEGRQDKRFSLERFFMKKGGAEFLQIREGLQGIALRKPGIHFPQRADALFFAVRAFVQNTAGKDRRKFRACCWPACAQRFEGFVQRGFFPGKTFRISRFFLGQQQWKVAV